MKILLAVPLLALPFIKLAEREFNDIDIGDVVNGSGPPTSIGGDSVPGLSPEFCDVLYLPQNRVNKKLFIRKSIHFLSICSDLTQTWNRATVSQRYPSMTRLSFDAYGVEPATNAADLNRSRCEDCALEHCCSNAHHRYRQLYPAMIHGSVHSIQRKEFIRCVGFFSQAKSKK